MSQKKEVKTEKNSSLSQRIQEIIAETKKEFGEESISTLEESGLRGRNVLPTGSLLLDQATSTGGYVYGTIIEIFGQPGIGKTTLALHAVRECQKQGKIAAYIDLENKLEKNNEWTKNIGVNDKQLIKFDARGGEEVFDFIDKSIEKGVNLFVVDSVAALVPKVHLEKGPESRGIASKARLMSERLPITNLKMRGKDAIIMFINQVREDLSTNYSGPNKTSKIITPGGWSLEFHSGLRVMLSIKERLPNGIKTQAKIYKNSFGSPNKKADLEIIFAHGVQKEREIIDLAAEINVIQKNGNWYSYENKKLGNGKENVTDYLIENPELYQEIERSVVKIINGTTNNIK